MEQSNLNNYNDNNEPNKINADSQNKPQTTPPDKKEKKKASKKDKTSQKQNNPKGLFLKETRLKKGLSLENVHEATKVPMDALRAIEEGYNVKILSPFYIKGFMKIYAKYLDVDIEEVVDDYKKEKLPQHISDEGSEFDFNQWFSKLLTKEQKQKIVLVVGGIIALFLVFKVFAFIGGVISKLRNPQRPVKSETKGSVPLSKIKVKKQPEVKKPVEKTPQPVTKQAVSKGPKAEKKEINVTQPVIVKPSAKKEAVSEAGTAQPGQQLQTSIPTMIQSSKKVILTVRAQRNSWLRVKSDGEVVFQSTLRQGSVETWVADKEIELSGKNIYYLEFELNGKMIGTLGRKDRRAKRLIVTKDGLKVFD